MIAASQPATAIPQIRARGVKPKSLAFCADMISIADAPSDKADDVAAVTVPPLGSNTGRNAANDCRLASGRITSSIVQSCRLPFSS